MVDVLRLLFISVPLLLSDISCWLHVFSFHLSLNLFLAYKLPNIKNKPNINKSITRLYYLAFVSLLSFKIKFFDLRYLTYYLYFLSTGSLASPFPLIVLAHFSYVMLKSMAFFFFLLPSWLISYLSDLEDLEDPTQKSLFLS